MKTLLLLLFLIPNLAFSLPETLNQYISKHPNWETTDIASLSYITTRCGILFVVISERYKNLPNAQNVYKQSLNNAAFFTKFSSAAYEVAGGKTKAFQDRARTWAEIYGKEGVKNIDIYGEFIRTDIKSDISTCMGQVMPSIK